MIKFSTSEEVLGVEVSLNKDNGEYATMNFFLYGLLQYSHKTYYDKNYYFEINQDLEHDWKVIFKILCGFTNDKNKRHYSNTEEVFSTEIQDYKDYENVRILSSEPTFDGNGMISNLKWHVIKGKLYEQLL